MLKDPFTEEMIRPIKQCLNAFKSLNYNTVKIKIYQTYKTISYIQSNLVYKLNFSKTIFNLEM